MSKKSAIYNFVGVLLVLFGLALIGISIFLFAKSGFNTLSQFFFFTALYYTFTGLFGLVTHRIEKCTWYKYYTLTTIGLIATQFVGIVLLGFMYNNLLSYLELVEGGDEPYVTNSAHFIQNSRIAWLIFFSLFLILTAVQANIAWFYYKSLYKQWITDEFNRLHDVQVSTQQNNASLMGSNDHDGKGGKKYKNKGKNAADEPLIV